MPKTSLLICITILTVSLMGCSANNRPSDDATNTSKQETTADNAHKDAGNAPDSEQTGTQNVPGAKQVPPFDQLLEAALNGNYQVIEKAIDDGFNVETTDDQMHTLLMMAAYNGHSMIVRLLLDRGAVVDHRDILDRTALMYASTGPFNETVNLLLAAGADPNLVDGDEHFTPLMFAAAEGQAEVVATLLEHGANKSMVDVDGESAYDFAVNNGHTNVANMLK
jgi:ankyrin repeat protein